MGKRITIQPHLSVAELKSRYLKAKDPVERSHYQIVWLIAQGKRTSEVALGSGYSSHGIRTVVRRYNQSGAAGLGDRRHNHPGGKPLLDDVQQARLWQALHEPAPDGGLWNSRKVAEWISEQLERPIAPQRGWDYLQQMGFRLCAPRPQHLEADPLEQAIWKKKLAAVVAQVQKDHPQAVVELWTMDEHRLGLKPVLRRVWVPIGEQPTARVHWRYQWLWVYGFVRPESGENYWWIRTKVNIKLFNQVLADFAREFGAGKDKRIILTLDQAGWHTSEQVQVPEGIHLEFMPSHSPELQPAQRLWPLTNEPIANQSFETLDDLEQVLFHRCQVLLKQRELIRRLTCFHWWPRTAIS